MCNLAWNNTSFGATFQQFSHIILYGRFFFSLHQSLKELYFNFPFRQASQKLYTYNYFIDLNMLFCVQLEWAMLRMIALLHGTCDIVNVLRIRLAFVVGENKVVTFLKYPGKWNIKSPNNNYVNVKILLPPSSQLQIEIWHTEAQNVCSWFVNESTLLFDTDKNHIAWKYWKKKYKLYGISGSCLLKHRESFNSHPSYYPFLSCS